MNYIKESKTTTRKTNIELLRIIAMLLIISFHYVYKSGYISEVLNYNTLVVKSFYFFGELGVNLFALITGYFMINGTFKLKKLILLLIEVLFYYLLITFIGVKAGILSMPNNGLSMFLAFFPTILSKYWFISAYVIIYILSPYLNILAKSLSKKEYLKFLITVLTIWCIIPTIFGVFFNTSESLLYYSRLIWMIILYFVGAYIKIHDFNILKSNKKKMLCALISYLAMEISIVLIYVYKNGLGKIGLYELSYFWTPNNILMFLLSISIFGIFLNIKMKNVGIINLIASTTLGIYLVHDGEICFYIWNDIFKANEHLMGRFPICNILLASFIVLLCGIVIDLLRQVFEKNIISKMIDLFFKEKKSYDILK